MRMLLIVLTILAVAAAVAAFVQFFIAVWAESGTMFASGVVTVILTAILGGTAAYIHDEVDY